MVAPVGPFEEFDGDDQCDGRGELAEACFGVAVGAAPWLPEVRQPRVCWLNCPALPQRHGPGLAAGWAAGAFGGAHPVVEAEAVTGCEDRVPGIAAIKVQGLDITEQAAAPSGAQRGLQQGLVAAVGAVGGPAHRDTPPVCEKRPLPTRLAPVNRALARSSAAAGSLVNRPANRGLRQIETHEPAIALQSLAHHPVEHPVGAPRVATGAQRGLAALAQTPRHVPRTTRHQPEQDPLEHVPAQDPAPATPQRVPRLPTNRQLRLQSSPQRIHHPRLQSNHPGNTPTQSLSLGEHPTPNPGQHNHKWIATY